MNYFLSFRHLLTHLFLALILATFSTGIASAQERASARELATYSKIRLPAFNSAPVEVKDLILKKDRVQIVLTGSLYLSEPVDGHITAAVFTGTGKLIAETPAIEFEKNNLKRLLGVETLESDFTSAVFRFSDDTERAIGPVGNAGAANERIQKRLAEVEQRILKETGASPSARVALSLVNSEKRGFFLGHFEGGKRGRFSYLFDPQCRIPVANFGLDGGEKGIIWQYKPELYANEIWLAFYSLSDFQRGGVEYSDTHDQIDISRYEMELDLREHKKRVRILAKISAISLQSDLQAIAFRIGEGLSEFENLRLDKQLHVKSAQLGGEELTFAQEDWEGGFTLFLNRPLSAAEKFDLNLVLEGDFMYDSKWVDDCHYPRSSVTWLPRHGYLDRATFNLTFKHPKRLLIASVGTRVSESPDPENKDTSITKYEMPVPVPIVTFALAPFERHMSTVKWDRGGNPTPLEFNSLSGREVRLNEDFVLKELNNTIRYFTAIFGEYPYPAFGATFHPFGYGQGFPTMLMIPPADQANNYTFQFLAHETAHQWWGNIVAWRSYRDQWLSEGFAEYSGVLYTGLRMDPAGMEHLIKNLRASLALQPETQSGYGKGRLVDIGPIILGHRLSTSKSLDAYEKLIYNKGALVLRMIHFMLSEPGSGNPKEFFDMMTDFVNRYRNRAASTDDFREVVNQHFAKSPIAKTYHLKDLNWLFWQTVYQTGLPSYELQYKIEEAGEGRVILSGTITQQNVPEDWGMVLPIKLTFGDKDTGVGTVIVKGSSSPFKMELPRRPKKVELDPDKWILSEKTLTKGN